MEEESLDKVTEAEVKAWLLRVTLMSKLPVKVTESVGGGRENV